MDNSKKIKSKKNPTINQRRVFDKVVEQVEKGGKVSISKAARDAGLASTFAKNPSKITKSKGFMALMDKYLPDTFLAQKHKELLNRKEVIRVFNKETGENYVEETEHLDVQAVKAGLDMAFKIKGHYSPEKHKVEHNMSLKDLFGLTAKDE